MILSTLLKDIPVLEYTADLNTEITGVSYDSRRVETGHLFVAITGYAADGHRHQLFLRRERAGRCGEIRSGDELIHGKRL